METDVEIEDFYMKMKQPFLFIGGYAHGKTIYVRRDVTTHGVVQELPPRKLPNKQEGHQAVKESYNTALEIYEKRRYYKDGEEKKSHFVLAGLSVPEANDMLDEFMADIEKKRREILEENRRIQQWYGYNLKASPTASVAGV